MIASIGAIYLYRLADALTGNRQVGLIAALLYALDPLLIRQAAAPAESALFTTLLTVFTYYFVTAAAATGMAFAGVALGLVALTRTMILPLAAFAAALLPAGCGLSPSPSLRTGDNTMRAWSWAGLPISSNPWTGTDRAIVASMVERVIDPPRLPDGPALTSRELARFRLRLGDGVEEAYAAVNTDGGPSLITVNAVRYAGNSQLPSWQNSERVRPGSFRLKAGRTLLTVSGNDGPCLQAVEAHVKDVANRSSGRSSEFIRDRTDARRRSISADPDDHRRRVIREQLAVVGAHC